MASTMRGAPLEDDGGMYSEEEFSEEDLDEQIAASPEMPSSWYFGAGWAFLVVGVISNLAQMITSGGGTLELGIQGMEGQALNIFSPTASPLEVLQTVGQVLPIMISMAAILAMACQLFMHMYAQPLHVSITRLRTLAQKKQLVKHFTTALNFKSVVCILAIAGNIITDAVFAQSIFHNVVITFLWCVVMSGCSTFMAHTGWTWVHTSGKMHRDELAAEEAEREVMTDMLRENYERQYGLG